MVILKGVIGWVSAWVARDVLRIFLELDTILLSFAIIAGYAGGDFIENVFKIAMKEPNLFEVGREIKEVSEEVEDNLSE